ncbi:MAG: MFS transporter [Nocardioidaceae bacterium]
MTHPASPTSHPANERGRFATARIVMRGGIGNFIEWYDWTVYGLLAALFAQQIFPNTDETLSLLATLGSFAIGFVARPLGSVLLSPYGDRHGRRRLLSLTIVIMGACSLVIAVTPSYGSIGIFAPLIFVVARLIQGVSAGAEFQSASAYVVEHAPPDRRALYGSAQLISIGAAILAATATSSLITQVIPEPALSTWGWRIPFALGAVMSLYGLYLRMHAPESPSFEHVAATGRIRRNPIRSSLRQHPVSWLRVVAIQMMTVPFYLWTVFLPTYANLSSGLPLAQGMIGSTIALLVFTVTLPFAGVFSDRVAGRRPMLLFSSLGFVLLAYPLLQLLKQDSFALFLLADVVGCLLMVPLYSVMAAAFCELFPPEVRTSGIGVPYAITTAVFGGTIPLIATSLIGAGHPDLIAAYVMAVCLVAAAVYWKMPETVHAKLDEPVDDTRRSLA